jgi:phosphoserine phosphatase
MIETTLINLSGHDKPGLISSITRILAAHNVCILDIGQAVVHEELALGILVAVDESESGLRSELMDYAEKAALQVRFVPVNPSALEHWAASQSQSGYLVTLLGRTLSAEQISRVGAIVTANDLNIDRIERLSGPLSLGSFPADNLRLETLPCKLPGNISNAGTACIELRVSGEVRSANDMRAAFLALAHELRVDIAFQKESIYRRNRRLFAFDMDSTLIQGEVIDELAKMAGVADQVVAITERAMRGELDFKQSFRRRVALLKGLPESRLLEVLEKIPLVDGAEHLVSTLKMLGYKTAILSGGFNFFGRRLQDRLGIDYVYANELELIDGVVSGEVSGEIVDGARKAALLRQIAEWENISLEQVVAVGDGANDLPMLNLAGMGIAFRAKPVVRQGADHAVSFLGLDSLLYLIGVHDRDLTGLAASHLQSR